jgi:hypothetical protein
MQPETQLRQAEESQISPEVAKWFAAFQHELIQQNKLLQSIKNSLAFFVVLTILAIILQACSVLGL